MLYLQTLFPIVHSILEYCVIEVFRTYAGCLVLILVRLNNISEALQSIQTVFADLIELKSHRLDDSEHQV